MEFSLLVLGDDSVKGMPIVAFQVARSGARDAFRRDWSITSDAFLDGGTTAMEVLREIGSISIEAFLEDVSIAREAFLDAKIVGSKAFGISSGRSRDFLLVEFDKDDFL